MNTNNSISNSLKKLLEINTNSLKTFERINEAITTNQKDIPLEILTDEGTKIVSIPGFGFMKKELAPFAHQKKIELAPFAPKKKSELAPLRDRKAKIARCGAQRKTSGAGLVALRPRGLRQNLPRKALNPPEPACGAI